MKKEKVLITETEFDMKRFIITFLLMLSAMTSCTQRRATGNPAAESPEHTADVNALQSFAEQSLFDELAGDMVYVEQDTGSFYICKYEVTQKLWKAVMEENPSDMQGDDLPVEQVSWNDCQRFISRLNGLTGKNYRLPTEAEWEYACRGGKYSKAYAYSGSNNIDEVAWYDKNSEGQTHPVGQKKPNELGLYDMSGNVWELCQDMHEFVGSCRGGSWIHNARNCDPSLPNETPQAFSINCIGLRLAL